MQLGHPFALPDLAESGAGMQCQAGGVFREYARLQSPESVALRSSNQLAHQGAAYALAMGGWRDVDADFRHPAVDRARRNRSQHRPPDQGIVLYGHQAACLQMVGIPLLPSGRFGLECGVAAGDAFLIDAANVGPILREHGA